MSIELLKLKLGLDYFERKSKYDMETELLKIKREWFYKNNPDFPYGNMFLQVTAPPKRFEIKIT